MGGGGGSGFSWPEPKQVHNQLVKAEQEASDSSFGTQLATELGELLGNINKRDVESVNARLSEIKSLIEDRIEGTINTLYGGSVARHTYVDGLSDIDSLLILNDTDLPLNNPHDILSDLTATLKKGLGQNAEVDHGRMAISIKYPDGMEIQCLPAVHAADGLKVPSWRRDNQWSDIDPKQFEAGLTKRNEQCNGKLIPTIKLAKAINATLPDVQQLTGYHVESLAIAAFRNYTDQKIPTRMLPHFFERARDLVLSPMKDNTGQSVHVDAHLGPENSAERQQVSHILNRVAKRMRNATAAGSMEQWKALFT